MSKKGIFIALPLFFGFMYLIIAGLYYFGYAAISRVQKEGFVYIPTGSNLDTQAAILYDNGFIKDSSDYKRYARRMDEETVYPGKFKLEEGMSYRELMSVVNHNKQTPVNLIFNTTNSIHTLAAKVASQIEADSASIVTAIGSDSLQNTYGIDSLEMITLFIPNTYQVYWNTSAEAFIARMKKEYDAFWNAERSARCDSIGMTRMEVMTLAAIVKAETNYTPEMARIAGVYMNRLKKGIPLQADPTVKHALGDPTIRRILKEHLKVKSPYNTYINQGLPPSPINIPPISAIDAVLNYEKNDFLYFCASEKLDGTHNFEKDYNRHLSNARKYAKKLNEMGIK